MAFILRFHEWNRLHFFLKCFDRIKFLFKLVDQLLVN